MLYASAKQFGTAATLSAYVLPNTDPQALHSNKLLWSQAMAQGVGGIVPGVTRDFVMMNTFGIAHFERSSWQGAQGIQGLNQVPDGIAAAAGQAWLLVSGPSGYIQPISTNSAFPTSPIPIADPRLISTGPSGELLVAKADGSILKVSTDSGSVTPFHTPAVTGSISELRAAGKHILSLRSGAIYHLDANAQESKLVSQGVESIALSATYYYYLTSDRLMAGLLPKAANFCALAH